MTDIPILTTNQSKQLGYSKLEVAELVNAMNKLLANYVVHYQKLRNFHWNVTGPDFFELHSQFELQYNQVKQNIDAIAERIKVFGQKPLSTLKEYLFTAKIKEPTDDLTSHEMTIQILEDYHILLEFMFGVIEMSIEHGDSATEELVKAYVKETEKNHWKLSAFLKE